MEESKQTLEKTMQERFRMQQGCVENLKVISEATGIAKYEKIMF